MRRTALLFASLALTLAAGCGSAGETPTVGVSHRLEPIAGGQVDTTHKAAVGIGLLAGGGIEMCSGTLIAPNLVLTARHCVSPISGAAVICGSSPFGTPYNASQLFITTDNQIDYGSNFVRGQEVRVPSEGNDTCGYDVALIILQSSIKSVTPYMPRIDKEVQLGEVYTAVGYGTVNPQNAGGGTRMERTGLRVSWYRGQGFDAVCNNKPECGYGVQSSEFQGETGVCEGDSGGPALDADNKVIGVVSRGYQCDVPVYGAVYTWKDFIVKGALDAAKAGGYAPPEWAVTGSTSGTGGAGGTGAGGAGGTAGQSAGGAGGGPVTTADPQGTHCSGSDHCPSGYACVYDSDPSQAYCAARCETDACSPGLECVSAGNIKVCKNPQGGSDANTSSGCTVSEGRGPGKPVPWFVGLSVLGLAGLRRRRRR